MDQRCEALGGRQRHTGTLLRDGCSQHYHRLDTTDCWLQFYHFLMWLCQPSVGWPGHLDRMIMVLFPYCEDPLGWFQFPILHLVSDERQPFQHASWPRLVAFINSDMVAISNKESRTSREACRSIRQRVLQRILLKWFSYNLLALDQSGHMNNKQLNYCKTVYHILYKWLNDCLFQVDPDIGFRTCPQDISQGMTLVWLVQAMNGPMTLTLPSIQCALTLPVALLGKAVRWHDIWNREIWIITNQKGCGCLDVWP